MFKIGINLLKCLVNLKANGLLYSVYQHKSHETRTKLGSKQQHSIRCIES